MKKKEKIVMGILGICVMFLCFQIGRYAANVFTKVDAAPETIKKTVTLSPLEQRITSGEWEVKAYCTCEKCTGEKLENPVGAMGVLLVDGYSVAAPSDIPYASLLHIDGYGDVVVQDRIPSKVENENKNSLCIYFSNHSEAVEFGKKTTAVSLVKTGY